MGQIFSQSNFVTASAGKTIWEGQLSYCERLRQVYFYVCFLYLGLPYRCFTVAFKTTCGVESDNDQGALSRFCNEMVHYVRTYSHGQNILYTIEKLLSKVTNYKVCSLLNEFSTLAYHRPNQYFYSIKCHWLMSMTVDAPLNK